LFAGRKSARWISCRRALCLTRDRKWFLVANLPIDGTLATHSYRSRNVRATGLGKRDGRPPIKPEYGNPNRRTDVHWGCWYPCASRLAFQRANGARSPISSPTWKAQMSSCWRFGLGTNPDARQRRANATLNEIYRGAVGYLKGSHAAELPTFQELDCLS
jgi:hypothetical protein